VAVAMKKYGNAFTDLDTDTVVEDESPWSQAEVTRDICTRRRITSVPIPRNPAVRAQLQQGPFLAAFDAEL
jgi:hypothetical protein